MRIVVDIGHPAHIHFFKNFIKDMEDEGHTVKITSTNKDISLNLLNSLSLDYEYTGKFRKRTILKFIDLIKIDYNLYKYCAKFKPDMIVGFGSIGAAHASFLLRSPCILFDDDEYSYKFYKMFIKAMCTTHTFKFDLGKKHIKFNGYKELAYLHPNQFKPNYEVLDEIGLKEDDDFIIMRFVGWNAYHDTDKSGLTAQNKIEYVEKLSSYARVFISSENELPPELEKYKLRVSPEKVHDLLYFAKLLVGDTQTMTTEAAVLGTPAVRCNSFVGKNDMGNFIELESKYGLIFNYSDQTQALDKAIELIKDPCLNDEWALKRECLLKDKIDVTAFMTWFIGNYPESFKEMKMNPDFQYNFK